MKSCYALLLMLLPCLSNAAELSVEQIQEIAPTMTEEVATRALDAIVCAQESGQEVDKLIVVDMSLKSTEKRLWALDVGGRKVRLVLNDLVAHGSGSDRNNDGYADTFSNTPNSNMTSLGLYKISERYHGKNGWSRRLDGLFARFNSKARNRAVVMHPSNYLNPGRVGRSQGCPAVNPKTMAALEQAGLKNAVLWIDGPDTSLAREVAECASKSKARKHKALMLAIAKLLPASEPVEPLHLALANAPNLSTSAEAMALWVDMPNPEPNPAPEAVATACVRVEDAEPICDINPFDPPRGVKWDLALDGSPFTTNGWTQIKTPSMTSSPSS